MLNGRVLEFKFKSCPETFTSKFVKVLQDEFFPLLEKNKGLFISFVVHLHDFWNERSGPLKDDIVNCLKMASPGMQSRLLNGWAEVFIVYIMMSSFITTTTNDKIVASLNEVFMGKTKIKFSALEEGLMRALGRDGNKVKCWLHPNTSFTDLQGSDCKAIAITVVAMSTNPFFADVDFSQLKVTLRSQFGPKILTPVYYETGEAVKKKAIRALKIPHVQLSKQVLDKIREVCLGETITPVVEDNQEQIFSADVITAFELLRGDLVSYLADLHHKSKTRNIGSNFEQVLTPRSQLTYNSLPTSEKAVFRKGFQACHRKLFPQTKGMECCLQVENTLPLSVVLSVETQVINNFEVARFAVQEYHVSFNLGDEIRVYPAQVNRKLQINGRTSVVLTPVRDSQTYLLVLTGSKDVICNTDIDFDVGVSDEAISVVSPKRTKTTSVSLTSPKTVESKSDILPTSPKTVATKSAISVVSPKRTKTTNILPTSPKTVATKSAISVVSPKRTKTTSVSLISPKTVETKSDILPTSPKTVATKSAISVVSPKRTKTTSTSVTSHVHSTLSISVVSPKRTKTTSGDSGKRKSVILFDSLSANERVEGKRKRK
ncbi:uncharacterized protein LOC130641336 isoform X3 [Hydractinia symbiolongicarpus]|uniref:uncharacterized protein LOC130641336 isoform X3 n=1 Tax=Hydractinia symbiolongicarpus TaxID=13093 RepID=UPI00254E4A5C|nr:uncharacterized protein LOC130641336 isoform X3 [Hydractinia symbiolongicarpus]